ncbi:MAG: winged helix-turn-helix domain-containing protein [Stackebrandtia sp.]
MSTAVQSTPPLSARPETESGREDPAQLTVVVEFPGPAEVLGERMLAVLAALKDVVGVGGTVAVSPERSGPVGLTPGAGRPGPPRRREADDGRIRIYPHARMVRRGRTKLRFSCREFELLHFFASHPSRVFTREKLLRMVWGEDGVGLSSRTVDVYVRRLRARLADHAGELVTVRGVGYRLDVGDGVLVVDSPAA